jgi:hypothetical protein
MRKELKENRHKKALYERKSKIFKINETGCCAISWKLMNWYLGRYERELEERKREALIRMADEQYDSDSDIIELDSNGDCVSETHSRRSSFGEMVDQRKYVEQMQDQKHAIVGEI